MDPEDKELLGKTFALADENNKMLRKMRRNATWSSVFQITYWFIIIGVSVGAYYYIEPYISSIESIYQNAKTNINSVNSGANTLIDGINSIKMLR